MSLFFVVGQAGPGSWGGGGESVKGFVTSSLVLAAMRWGGGVCERFLFAMQQGSLPVFISQSFPVQPPVIGLVTLDRNSSQYYRDWGYSSILALHTRPLEKARRQHVYTNPIEVLRRRRNMDLWQRPTLSEPLQKTWDRAKKAACSVLVKKVHKWSEMPQNRSRNGQFLVKSW